MTRVTSVLIFGWLLIAWGCGVNNPRPRTTVDCSVVDAYDFRNIFDFSGSGQSGWFEYADNTPGGVDSQQVVPLNPPLCGNTWALELQAYGDNYYGAGFGDWENNAASSRADGTGYEGISFWARSPGNTDKTFMLYLDDGRTFVERLPSPGGGLLPVATPADQDLDGDGFVGPGDIARGTECRLPPIQALGYPACYYGGVLPPATPTRVPAPDECGNQFHTYITTTEDWQLFLIPWKELVQWPCPNRLKAGINAADIAQIEIKLLQGTVYDIWLQNIAFYRLRSDAGS